jgi:hypothetical protein
VSFSHAEGDIDVCLHDETGAVACSAGSSNTEAISYPLADEGVYSIRVLLFSDSGSLTGNTYTLTASKT